MRSSRYLLLCLLLLVAFLVIAEIVSKSSGLKSTFQSDSIPAELLCYNKLGDVFRQLGVIQFSPSETDSAPEITNHVTDTAFTKRRQVSNSRISASSGHSNDLQLLSQKLPENAPVEGELVISVATAPENLKGSNGIITNSLRRGKKWEKFSYVTIYSERKILFESAAGLRLHGGNSRNPDWEHHSFRLYFRKKYGNPSLNPKNILSSSYAIRTLVVHVDTPESWPLNTIIANDVYRRIGCKTLEYRPAKFYLNGEFQGIYWISEHLSEKKYLQKRFPDKSISSFRYRSSDNHGPSAYKTDLSKLAYETKAPLTKELVAQSINIVDLTNFYISVAYCGTTDWDQGVAYKFLNTEKSVWNWIIWDIDHSFIDWYKSRNKSASSPPWHQKGFSLFLHKKSRKIRNILFVRLITEDQEYRKFFIQRFTEITNHILTESTLNALADNYNILAKNFGLQGIHSDMKEFFQKRPGFLREELQKHLQIHEWFKLHINNRDLPPLIVDGYPEQGDYTGYYPTNMVVHIQPGKGKNPLYWLVNGEKQEETKLELRLQKDTTITPVYSR